MPLLGSFVLAVPYTRHFFGNAKDLHDIKMRVPLGFPVNSFFLFFLFFNK